ncbi:MAG: 23S rRNA (pseudouridine(1915)-N(3))-methyltransferase RlmH [Oscillospiraceae bacterium]
MIKINLIVIGKLKEKYWRDACSEYAKRLSSSCKLEIIELSESRLPDKPSEKEIAAALEREAKAILPYCEKSHTASIAMCIEGKQLASTQLADTIQDLSTQGYSTVNFIVGSSFGLSDVIKNKCRLKLSMSEMTFPHQLARVMLLEQIYRCFQILSGTSYHK